MSDSMKGERIRCACQADGEIIEYSNPLNTEFNPWFVVQHETSTHRIERFWNGEAFRFRFMRGGPATKET